MAASPPSRRPVARARRALWRFRHLLAAACLAGALGLTIEALRPPQPAGEPVVLLARDLPAGTVLGSRDLTLGTAVRGSAPRTALSRVSDAVGVPLAVGLAQDTVLTGGMLVGPGLAHSAPRGTVVVPVPLADAGSVHLAQPGSRVDLLASPGDVAGTGGPAEVVAADALVLATLPAADGGLLGSPGADASTVYVAVPPAAARLLVGASAWSPLRAVQAHR